MESQRRPFWKAALIVGGLIGATALILGWIERHPPPAEFGSSDALVAEIGCSPTPVDLFRQDAAAKLLGLGVDVAHCKIGDAYLVPIAFSSRKIEDEYLSSVRRHVTDRPDVFVVGDRWLVQSSNFVVADQIQTKLGGKIRRP